MSIIKYFLFIGYKTMIKILIIKDLSGSFSGKFLYQFRFREFCSKGFRFLRYLFILSTTSYIPY